ncbi:MAG: hypothetical protein IPO04_17745 [Cytophagaceae bacterium]|nr:hypothetical protein [Cytophagaceae bacterium]
MTNKKTILVLFILFSVLEGYSQKIQTNYFIRMANVANFNLSKRSNYYTPALATGFGLGYKSKFIEFAGFENKEDNWGLFTFLVVISTLKILMKTGNYIPTGLVN